jgi:hypothetical protein
MCPFLGLGLRILCCSFDLSLDDKLFNTTLVETFGTWFNSFKNKKNTGELIELFGLIDPSSISLYSIRKGVMTYLSTFPDGPPQCSILLRADQSLGEPQKRYIKGGKAGDAVCGRFAAGLNPHNEQFASLPPHFDNNNETIKLYNWSNIIPNFNSYPANFQLVIPYLVASVCHHYAWILLNLPNHHPFYQSRFHTSGVIKELKPLIHLGILKNEITGMTGTGIPAHVQQYISTSDILKYIKTTGFIPVSTEDISTEKLKDDERMTNIFTNVLNVSVQPLITQLAHLTELTQSLATNSPVSQPLNVQQQQQPIEVIEQAGNDWTFIKMVSTLMLYYTSYVVYNIVVYIIRV